jgi:hypothetical protein
MIILELENHVEYWIPRREYKLDNKRIGYELESNLEEFDVFLGFKLHNMQITNEKIKNNNFIFYYEGFIMEFVLCFNKYTALEVPNYKIAR